MSKGAMLTYSTIVSRPAWEDAYKKTYKYSILRNKCWITPALACVLTVCILCLPGSLQQNLPAHPASTQQNTSRPLSPQPNIPGSLTPTKGPRVSHTNPGNPMVSHPIPSRLGLFTPQPGPPHACVNRKYCDSEVNSEKDNDDILETLHISRGIRKARL